MQDSKTSLRFLGTGGAFSEKNGQSSAAFVMPSGKAMLIDCGSDARRGLERISLKYENVDAVYVTHLHNDHIGGLENFAYYSFFVTKKKPQLYGTERLIKRLWKRSLRGGMGCINADNGEVIMMGIDDYFDVSVASRIFYWENTVFRMVPVRHVDGMESHGLAFMLNDSYVLFTSDARFDPSILRDCNGTMYDRVFHDCDTSGRKSAVHAHYSDLKTLDPKIKERMWLYHYGDGPLPDAVADGFAGFVKPGDVFQ